MKNSSGNREKKNILRLVVHPYLWIYMYRYVIGPRIPGPMPPTSRAITLLVTSFNGIFTLNAVLRCAMHV
jgi:hypothetical protein